MPSFIRLILERRILYLIGLFGLGVGLPLGKAIISIGGIVLACAWLFDTLYFKDLKEKWRKFLATPIAWSMTGIFLLHLIGMLYTSDYDYGIADLRTKLPLLFMPLVFATMPPIERLAQRWLMASHHLAVAICMGLAIYFTYRADAVGSLRDNIWLISHIRLSLIIVLGLFLALLFYRPKSAVDWVLVAVSWAFGLWFLIQAQLMTGLFIFLALCAFFLLRYVFQKGLTLLPILGLMLLMLGSGAYVWSAYTDYFDTKGASMENEDDYTALGTPYFVPKSAGQIERGRFIWKHYAPAEMEKAWKKRSSADLFANELQLQGALTRYLTAKGLRKDAGGVAALSEEDIRQIEAGNCRPEENDKGALAERMDKLFFELSGFKSNNDPNGHSVTQRFEYWKTGVRIWAVDPFIGIGTGDVKQAFVDRYVMDDSPLRSEYRHRAHQQFLTIMIAFGIIGLLVFLRLFFRPLGLRTLRKDPAFIAFFLVLSLSFLNEDTLESQSGLTFYVFYMAILALSVSTGRSEKNL